MFLCWWIKLLCIKIVCFVILMVGWCVALVNMGSLGGLYSFVLGGCVDVLLFALLWGISRVLGGK